MRGAQNFLLDNAVAAPLCDKNRAVREWFAIFVFSMSRDRSIRKRRRTRWIEKSNIPTPDAAKCEPYYIRHLDF